MNTAKIYHDSEGNDCTIFQAVKREPEWAATRIQVGEKALENVARLEGMLIKKLDLIKCGISANYSGDPCKSQLYTEATDLLKEI